jgi:hypothetical protein
MVADARGLRETPPLAGELLTTFSIHARGDPPRNGEA